MDSLRHHRDYLEGEWRGLQAAPLSARKALLVAMLVDAYVDRLFAADPDAEDILVYRDRLSAAAPELGLVLALCARRPGFALVTEAVPVTDYGALAVEDFMVSLYNDQSVQRLLLVVPDGMRNDMLKVIAAAIAAVDGASRP